MEDNIDVNYWLQNAKTLHSAARTCHLMRHCTIRLIGSLTETSDGLRMLVEQIDLGMVEILAVLQKSGVSVTTIDGFADVIDHVSPEWLISANNLELYGLLEKAYEVGDKVDAERNYPGSAVTSTILLLLNRVEREIADGRIYAGSTIGN